MGGADIIPGVSGGTIALILGIYTRLVTSLSRFDTVFVSHLTRGRIRQALDHVDFRFLAAHARHWRYRWVALFSKMVSNGG